MSNDTGQQRPTRGSGCGWYFIPFIILMSVVVVANLVSRGTNRTPQSLAYTTFQEGWSQERNSYSREGETPLYDRAEIDYENLRLDMRAAKREGDAEVWHRVEIPSRRELTGEFFQRLATVQDFEHSTTRFYSSLFFQSRNGVFLLLLLALTVVLFIGMRRRRTSSVGPAFIAIIAVYWLYLLHEGGLPSNWLVTVRENTFERGPIPYLILWVGLFGFAYLLQIYAVYGRPYRNAQEFNALLNRLIRLYVREGDIAGVQRLRDEILEGHERSIHLAFTAVRYAEWILPLLGFLGTVLGLGQSLNYMQGAVKFTDQGVVITPEELNKTFGGMALSFYTTLWGLLGMLVLGLAHFWLRKQIEQSLNEVSIQLTRALESIPNQPSSVRVDGLPTEYEQLTLATATAVKQLQQNQAQVAELFLRCVREDPMLHDRFGPILFEESVVSSAEYERLSRRIQARITAAVNQKPWEIEALSTAPAPGGQCGVLVSVAQGTETVICLFALAAGAEAQKSPLQAYLLTRPCDRMTLCDNERILLRSTLDQRQGPRLFWWRAGTLETAPAHPDRCHDQDLIFGIPSGGGMTGAVLVHGDPASRKITCLPAQQGVPAYLIHQGVHGANWTLGAFAPDGRHLVLAGEAAAARHWKLLVFPVGSRNNQWVLDKPIPILLPHIHDLEQIEWLSKDELLLVRRTGDLLLFDRTSQPEPGVLQHADWHPGAAPQVCVGPDRMFAAFRSNMLSMWRITVSRGLVPSPNREWLQASNIRPPRIAVADNTRGVGCLLGGFQNWLTVWNFPQQRPPVMARPSDNVPGRGKE